MEVFTGTALAALREYWHIVTGSVLAVWWLLVRIKRSLFMNYATLDHVTYKIEDVMAELKQHEKEEVLLAEKLHEEHTAAHDKIMHRQEAMYDQLRTDIRQISNQLMINNSK